MGSARGSRGSGHEKIPSEIPNCRAELKRLFSSAPDCHARTQKMGIGKRVIWALDRTLIRPANS